MVASSRSRMSFLDRFLPVWIIFAMVAGLLVNHVVPGIGEKLGALEVVGISLPIALGLLVMMYPQRFSMTRLARSLLIDA